MINLNHLVRRIAELEGGKVNLPIGQIKEVLSLTLALLDEYADEDIRAATRRTRKARKLKSDQTAP